MSSIFSRLKYRLKVWRINNRLKDAAKKHPEFRYECVYDHDLKRYNIVIRDKNGTHLICNSTKTKAILKNCEILK
jgi:hypothetical protein